MRLIDADALIKEAGNLWSEIPDGEELSKELMKAINHAPTVGGWISVKDRMPDENEEVILFYEWTGRFSGNKYQEVGFGTIADLGKECFAIAWMPLPEPTEGGRKMSNVSTNGAMLNISQRLSTAGGFLMALGAMIVDHQSTYESRIETKTRIMVEDLACAVSFINEQGSEIQRLMEENHKLESVIVEQKDKIQKLESMIKEYCGSEQKITGR